MYQQFNSIYMLNSSHLLIAVGMDSLWHQLAYILQL